MIPARFTVQVKPFAPGGEDDFGNVSPSTFGPARDWQVRQIDPGAMAEPGLPARDLSLIAFSIHAEADSGIPDYRDLVVVDGKDYRVNGEPKDWTRGPWVNPAAGVVVELLRPEG